VIARAKGRKRPCADPALVPQPFTKRVPEQAAPSRGWNVCRPAWNLKHLNIDGPFSCARLDLAAGVRVLKLL